MMNRAIITGATGSIGIALIGELLARQTEVLVLCREGSARNRNIPHHPLITIKYCSLDELTLLENDTGKCYDVWFHFAWEGTMGETRNDMYLQHRNVKYTLDAVTAAERFSCGTFIGAGSQAEYGRVEGALNSATPPFPENGYGIGKLCAGQMSRILCEQKGMKHIWTRILSVYGPYDNQNTMIMSAIGKLLRGEVPAFTKCEQKWDYLYSKDAARAFVDLAERGRDGKVYCIGSGKALPLSDYIIRLRDAICPGAELGIGQIPYGPRQVMYLCADITELEEDTGFHPVYTFEEGIRDTIEWYKEYYYEKNQCTDTLL